MILGRPVAPPEPMAFPGFGMMSGSGASGYRSVAFRFSDVSEFEMEGFNHQNAMMSLSIDRREERRGPSQFVLAVTIEPAFGMGARFECTGIEVVEAIPCTPEGQLLS